MILNTLFFNYDLKEAVLDPRVHNQLIPNITVAEPGFDKVSVTSSKQQLGGGVVCRETMFYSQP